MTVIRYSQEQKAAWDQFVCNAKNGLFLFMRDYMDYHSDRFTDHSLMIYDDNRLMALLPANIQNKELISHSGLTFGGVISDSRMKTPLMLETFDAIIKYLKANSINKMVYKCIPHIYHSLPAEEDLYALFRKGAKLIRRDVTSAVYMSDRVKLQELRRRLIKKAESSNIEVKETNDFQSYWNILESNLVNKYGKKPVHSLNEIMLLQSRFPANIRLFASFVGDAMLSGVVIYESKNVAHAQYIASSDKGKETGALDILFSQLIEKYYYNKRYFDFGISTEENGLFLNEDLIFFKEGFGARAVAHDFYELDM